MTHTAKQMIPAINEQVIVRFESITVDCTVNDVKSSYGNIRLLVIPVAGGGSQWVELGRIQRRVIETPNNGLLINRPSEHGMRG